MTRQSVLLEWLDELIAKAPADRRRALDLVVDRLHRSCPDYHWTGIYLVDGDQLMLGPYRGSPTEHTRISLGKGICGSAAISGQTEIVDDVASDSRYLACFPDTRSEIVVPIRRNGAVIGEIDIDSQKPSAFNEQDQTYLELVAERLAELL
ncbi:MAG: GAF domain-containing protein [Acidobacteriota bacterium]